MTAAGLENNQQTTAGIVCLRLWAYDLSDMAKPRGDFYGRDLSKSVAPD